MKKLIRLVTVSITVVACALLATTATSQDGSNDFRMPTTVLDVARASDGNPSRAILQYDDGVAVYRDGDIGPNILFLGNFVSPGLPATTPYTVDSASIFMAGLYAGHFNVGFFRSPAHSTAPLELLAIRGIIATATQWNSVLFNTSIVSTGKFLVGVINHGLTPCLGDTRVGSTLSPNFTCEGVAIGPGTNDGHGHNAMRVSLPSTSATVGTGYATIPGQNALIRLVGNVPVELMRLDVE